MRMEDEALELPPGFRFHPTDEELITHYLSPKVTDHNFSAIAIGEVDLNKVEPWDLPGMAKMGEKEWYFYCIKDKKYPTGLRTNRATEAGYWKATGKDKEIINDKTLVILGMKKTLVFYKGRAPKGNKTNWVMHEYRLLMEATTKHQNPTFFTKPTKSEWVISRIFKKCCGGKKVHISDLIMPTTSKYTCTAADDSEYASNLSALSEHLSSSATNTIAAADDHVTCFSINNNANNLLFPAAAAQMLPFTDYYSTCWKLLFDGQNVKADFSEDQDQLDNKLTSVPLHDLDILWNY